MNPGWSARSATHPIFWPIGQLDSAEPSARQ
jgi:hypothetical protein